MAGFSSQAYFSDIFRRQMGESPLQYRKKNRAPSRRYD
jgi:AraC-like DNA-binding protein